MGFTVDAQSKYAVPVDGGEWPSLLSGTGIATPDHTWGFQEASGVLGDSIGSVTGSVSGCTYRVSVPGWARVGVSFADASANLITFAGLPNSNASSSCSLFIVSLGATPASTRLLEYMGGAYVQFETSTGKLDATLSGTVAGTIDDHGTVRVIVANIDQGNTKYTVYTDNGDTISPPWVMPNSATSMFLGAAIGTAPAMTVLYGARWERSLSAAQVAQVLSLIASPPSQKLVAAVVKSATGKVTVKPGPGVGTIGTVPVMGDNGAPITNSPSPVFAAGATLTALNAGSVAIKWVAAIEGYPFLLTDANPTAAAIAWSGTDWTKALPGLYVELDSEQSLDPWNPFSSGGGTCILRVQAEATDQFGIDVNRMAAGASALMRAGANRVGTNVGDTVNPGTSPNVQPYLAVDNGIGFVAGDAFVGTECFQVLSGDNTKINTSARGKYAPFPSGGSGGKYFSQHHRVAADTNGVLLNPTVSQQPRTWVGKWVGVWMHLQDGSGNLNSKANALCVFAGRITATSDDENTGYTCIELEHVLDNVKKATIGRDMYSATITEGMWIAAGSLFKFQDQPGVFTPKLANDLTVVASGAAGTNQINQGWYSLEELCDAWNKWLGGETAAGRIYGGYTWASPVTAGNDVYKTKCYWQQNYQSPPGTNVNTGCQFYISAPYQVMAFLGLVVDTDGTGVTIATAGLQAFSGDGVTNQINRAEGPGAPWRTVFFHSNAQLTNFQMNLENDRGTIFDQYALLPSLDKPASSQGLQWGIFLLDQKYLIRASFDVESTTTVLSNCSPLRSYQLPGVTQGVSLLMTGKRADDNAAGSVAGQVSIKQVYILETTLGALLNTFFYNTGTNGYNHPQYDTLGYGIGLGVPAALLGAPFEASIAQLPYATAPVACVIDEPTTLADLLDADTQIRWAFPVWKQGSLRFAHWQAPISDYAVAALDETNKAAPSGDATLHRAPTILTDQWMRNVVKLDYDRDITAGSDGSYTKTITFEDHVSVDDAGGASLLRTIKARNAMTGAANTGASIESIAPGFLSLMPLFSRPVRKMTRSIDQRYFERVSVGDVVLVSDKFARDPASGTRGISARPAVIIHKRYNPGGPTPGDPSSKTDASGEVDLLFLDLHRWAQYAPCADVDETMNVQGFAAGYSTAQLMLLCQAHGYSENTEAFDATSFVTGDAIVIIERDPVDPSNPLVWRRRVTSQISNQLTIDSDLAGWDATRRYRITYDAFNNANTSQQGKAFLASQATGKIQGVTTPYQLTSTQETGTFTPIPGTFAELVPASSYADGAACDVGAERALVRTANAYIDGKSIHQAPSLWIDGSSQQMSVQAGGYQFAVMPFFLGSEMIGQASGVSRSVTVAPVYRSAAGIASSLRVSLCKTIPVQALWSGPGNGSQVAFLDTVAQATWTTTSTTFAVGQEQQLAVSKDINGLCWIVVELTGGTVAFAGLAKCVESGRSPP